MSRRGFTLAEVLTVVAIVVLLAAIIVPVSLRGMRDGNIADAKSNLRQVGIATLLYREGNGGRYPLHGLDALVTTNLITDPRILLARGDPDPIGHGRRQYQCLARREVNVKTSIHSAFQYSPRFGNEGESQFWIDRVRTIDPNPGIAVITVYGETKRSLSSCADDPLMEKYSRMGFLIRLREDGSVQRAYVTFRPLRGGPDTYFALYWYWTDNFAPAGHPWNLDDEG